MENQVPAPAPVVVIGGIQYDTAEATDQTKALIRDLTTVQMEMSKYKISYDIAQIAKQSLLGNISNAIAMGESGLVELEVPEAPAEPAKPAEPEESDTEKTKG